MGVNRRGGTRDSRHKERDCQDWCDKIFVAETERGNDLTREELPLFVPKVGV